MAFLWTYAPLSVDQSNDVTRSGRCSAGAEGIPCTGSPPRLRQRKRMTHRPDLEAGQGVKIRR